MIPNYLFIFYLRFNVSIIFNRGIRKARTNVHSSNRHGELNLAVTLITICSVFIVCHAPRLFLGLKAVFLMNTTFECMKQMKVEKSFQLLIMIRFDIIHSP